MEHALDEARGLGARQAELAVDDVGEVGPSQSAGQCVAPGPRNSQIGHNISPAPYRLIGRRLH